MKHIILVAETGADIPPETAHRYGIYIVPMHVAFGDATRDDGDFPSEEICAYYERTRELPKTSGSTPEDFIRAFDQIHAEYPEAHILHLAYSAATTCSYQSARIAAEDRDYVTSLDTKAVTIGQYSIVVRMAQLLEEHPEREIGQAVPAAEELIRRSRMCFIPDELEYLRAGGRVSNAAALCGKLLSIHPRIELLDGRLVATKKLRGRMAKLAPNLVEEFAAQEHLERDELWLVWTPGFPDELRAPVEESAKRCGFQRVTWAKAGGVITTHGGPAAFGVAGFTEN